MSIIKDLPAPMYDGSASASVTRGRTVGDVISQLLRSRVASLPLSDGKEQSIENIYVEDVPIAPDLFGVCAYLLELSGAYGFYLSKELKPKGKGLYLWLSEQDHKDIASVSQEWRNLPWDMPCPKGVKSLWSELISYWDFPINHRVYRKIEVSPVWWKIAYKIQLIADETCFEIGFLSGDASKYARSYRYERDELIDKLRIDKKVNSETKNPLLALSDFPPTLCQEVDPDVVCVQPKCLVPKIGSGTRVFSMHLSILKNRTSVRTQWIDSKRISERDAESRDLNILFLNIPKSLTEKDFIEVNANGTANPEHGRFKINQSWIAGSKFVEKISNIVNYYNNEMEMDIHGVVFPELALNLEEISKISAILQSKFERVDFFISGSSENCDGMKGNFVWNYRFFDGKRNKRISSASVQPKHHRWKMDQSQINRYKLEKSLPNYNGKDYSWWENINVGKRELSFIRLRKYSLLSTLICEDLARSEPCHDVLRSVGPNLLIALLMDGPQEEYRWSANYANTLWDDPGCTAITFTGTGLMSINDVGKKRKKIISIRDSGGNRGGFSIHPTADAIVVNLVSDDHNDISIDGRVKTNRKWRLKENICAHEIFAVEKNVFGKSVSLDGYS